MLPAGQAHDIHSGRALLVSVLPMRKLIADKACDANDLRDFLANQGIEPAGAENHLTDSVTSSRLMKDVSSEPRDTGNVGFLYVLTARLNSTSANPLLKAVFKFGTVYA